MDLSDPAGSPHPRQDDGIDQDLGPNITGDSDDTKTNDTNDLKDESDASPGAATNQNLDTARIRHGSSASSGKEQAFASSPQYRQRRHTFETLASRHASVSAAQRARRHINANLANPLADHTPVELREAGAQYARDHAIIDPEDLRAFRLGAVLARDPSQYEDVEGLTDEELDMLRREANNRWHQPWKMYMVILISSVCAAVQGMDETVVNGGQIFYYRQFGINDAHNSRQTWLQGLVNAAPYVCCAFIGCWLTVPFNNWFGRRGTIFLTCLYSAVACFWQGFTNAWWSMFVARFALGFGIGPKSATVPIYAAETSPPAIRGALVMQWQMWTAFGIMLGYASDLAFYSVPDTTHITGLNWRLMMGSAMLPAVIVCCFVFLIPESPRWYMSKGRHHAAYESLCKLRYCKVQAARDAYYMYVLLEAETSMRIGQSKVREIITVPRNRRALLASEIVMFMQQFCGVNVIAYYSSQIFLEANFSEISALSASLGFGLINFLFAIPAIYTIDTFGRRNLLLTTFPLMGVFLLLTGFSFWIPSDSTARLACVALGMYLFGIVYSPGEGPVPFTYSAEAYPLYVRAHGMSIATATTWFFNAVLSITWPALRAAFTSQGAFGFYAAWNFIGFFLVLLFVPETKGLSLEELDRVFSVPTHLHALYGLRQLRWFIMRYVLFRKVEPEEMLEREGWAEEVREGIDADIL